MSDGDVAISVSGLGKAYSIWHNRARATTMAEAVAGTLRRVFRDEAATRETFWALRDVNFQANRGEVVGVIGRNGAGKSTLLKILSRITEPSTGRVDLYGRVGSLLEIGTGFHTELTGRENIFLNGAILGMRRKEIQRQFDAIVDFAAIEKFLDTPVKRYSSGMYVRLAFAVAAHLQNDILLVDEVLAVGDAQFQRKCLGKMKDVATAGRTVVFVSHNMSAVADLCTSGIMLRGGQCVQRGDLRECIESYLGETLANQTTFDRGPLKFVSIRQDGDTLELIGRYECDSPIKLPSFAFLISDMMGMPICSANPRVNGLPPRETATKAGEVRVLMKKPLLVDGSYRLSVWMGDGHEDFVHHRDCLTFGVAGMAGPRQIAGSLGGPVHPECQWWFDGEGV